MKKLLRLVYRNKTNLSFEDLLKKNETVNIHHRYLQTLATTEICKELYDLAPEIIKDIFHFVVKPYKLRNNPTLKRKCNVRCISAPTPNPLLLQKSGNYFLMLLKCCVA